MLTYAERAESFVAGVDFDAFCEDEQKALAVVRALEVIGKGAAHVPGTVRRRYPEVPWTKIIGMRNILIDGYFVVDLAVIWRTIHEDLPPFRPQIARALENAAREGREAEEQHVEADREPREVFVVLELAGRRG